MVELTLELRSFGSPSNVLSLKTLLKMQTGAARDLVVCTSEFWYLLNRYCFLMQNFFFEKEMCLSVCISFYQIEPLGLFIFNKEETLGSGTAEPSTIAASSLALSF